MKRLVYTLLASLALGFLLPASCKKNSPLMSERVMETYAKDSAYIADKRTLIVGVSDYKPLDWQEGGEWTGFDADLARLFAKKIGVQAVFKEIDWSQKIGLLENGTIDCIWNGMTRTQELERQLSCSRPYLTNQQIILLPKANVDLYAHESECTNLLFAVEAASTGEQLLKAANIRYVSLTSQKEAVQAVREGRTDGAIIDSIMAVSLIADAMQEAASPVEVGWKLALNYEQMSIALRKGSDLLPALDSFLQQSEVDGTINALKKKYGME